VLRDDDEDEDLQIRSYRAFSNLEDIFNCYEHRFQSYILIRQNKCLSGKQLSKVWPIGRIQEVKPIKGEWISKESSIEAQNVTPGTPHQ